MIANMGSEYRFMGRLMTPWRGKINPAGLLPDLRQVKAAVTEAMQGAKLKLASWER